MQVRDVAFVPVQQPVVIAQGNLEALGDLAADAAARQHVETGIVGVISEAAGLILVRTGYDMRADAHRRRRTGEEEQLEVVAERNVDLRTDRNVQIHLGQADLLGEVIRLFVRAEVHSGAIAEIVAHALAVLETDLDADGIVHII